jgi:hypothetical protein
MKKTEQALSFSFPIFLYPKSSLIDCELNKGALTNSISVSLLLG